MISELFREVDLTDEDAWPREKASRQRIEDYADTQFNLMDMMLDAFNEDGYRIGLDDGEVMAAWEIFRERMIRNLGAQP